METRLRKDKDILFFDVEGRLDLQGVDHLKDFCFNGGLNKKKVVFNLKALSFVGSKGVEVFSQTLDFVNKNNRLKICCAGPEFQKILDSEGLNRSLFPSEREAVLSFEGSNQNEGPPK